MTTPYRKELTAAEVKRQGELVDELLDDLRGSVPVTSIARYIVKLETQVEELEAALARRGPVGSIRDTRPEGRRQEDERPNPRRVHKRRPR